MTAKPVNQHDLWHPNPRHDPDAFRNRPAIVVDDRNMPPNNAKRMVRKNVFTRLESLERVDVEERAQSSAPGRSRSATIIMGWLDTNKTAPPANKRFECEHRERQSYE